MSAYVFITLHLLWGGDAGVTPTVTAGPGFYYYNPETGNAPLTLEPTTLTWTPEDGFGAESTITYAPLLAERAQ